MCDHFCLVFFIFLFAQTFCETATQTRSWKKPIIRGVSGEVKPLALTADLPIRKEKNKRQHKIAESCLEEKVIWRATCSVRSKKYKMLKWVARYIFGIIQIKYMCGKHLHIGTLELI